MPQQINDPALAAFATGAMLLSAATWLCLLAARSRGPLLQFRPRSPVPWNGAGGMLALALVLLTLWSALEGWTAPEPAAKEHAKKIDSEGEHAEKQDSEKVSAADQHAATQLIAFMLPEVILVGGVLLLIAVYFDATARDLGLPANSREFSYDVLVGVVVGLAALAPVRLIQGLLLYWWGEPDMQSGHPLVKMLTDGKADFGVLLLASLAAVVVAPICEEIAFRLLLQGWLEKWEAEKVECCVAPAPQTGASEEVQPPEADNTTNAECRMPNGGNATDFDNSSIVVRHSSLETPPHGFAGLPFGWVPITISALLFGLAHFGYGPEPVPLFFLALILGYVYHRTHRIVPCIVAHSLFNSFTMLVLWRMVLYGTH